MENKNEKYLPIGTVVLLKGGTRRLMITGYATIDMEKRDKIFDYCGCVYPIGVIDNKQNLLFNHKDIEEISAMGYQDEEQKAFMKRLKESLTEKNIKIMLETIQNQDKE